MSNTTKTLDRALKMLDMNPWNWKPYKIFPWKNRNMIINEAPNEAEAKRKALIAAKRKNEKIGYVDEHGQVTIMFPDGHTEHAN